MAQNKRNSFRQKQAIENVTQGLYKVVGNKVYMRDLEILLKKIPSETLTPQNIETLKLLARDLKFSK